MIQFGLTRRQSQRRYLSRLLQSQESRQAAAWLIFDVGQKMNTQDPVAFRRWQFRWRAGLAVCAALLTCAPLLIVFPSFVIFVPIAAIACFFWWAWRSGRAGRITAACIVSTFTVLVVAAEMHSRAQNRRIEVLRAATESSLTAQLSPGDASEKIERVLRENGLQFTYSEVLHGYYATVATGVPDTRIDVTLAVTDGKHLAEIRVRTFFISL